MPNTDRTDITPSHFALTRDCLRCGADVAIQCDEPFVLHVYCNACLEEMAFIEAQARLVVERIRA